MGESNEAVSPAWHVPAAWGVFLIGNWLLYLNAKFNLSIYFLDMTGLRKLVWPYYSDGFNYGVNSIASVLIAVLFIGLISASRLQGGGRVILIIVVLLLEVPIGALNWGLWQFSMTPHH